MDMPEFELQSTSSVMSVLQQFVQIIVTHPVAAQAAITALAREGRNYINTPEGEAWAQSLVHSELLQEASAVWEAASIGMLDEHGDGVLPSGYIDSLFVAAGDERLTDRLRAILSDGVAAP